MLDSVLQWRTLASRSQKRSHCPPRSSPDGKGRRTHAPARDNTALRPVPSEHLFGDDDEHRRDANRALVLSALGLSLTGGIELVIALVSGSVGLLGDAIHNLADVSTSLVAFVGFRVSRRIAGHFRIPMATSGPRIWRGSASRW